MFTRYDVAAVAMVAMVAVAVAINTMFTRCDVAAVAMVAVYYLFYYSSQRRLKMPSKKRCTSTSLSQ